LTEIEICSITKKYKTQQNVTKLKEKR